MRQQALIQVLMQLPCMLSDFSLFLEGGGTKGASESQPKSFKSVLKVKPLKVVQNVGQSHCSHKSASSCWLQLLLKEDRAICAITNAINVLSFKVSPLFTCHYVSSPAKDEFTPETGKILPRHLTSLKDIFRDLFRPSLK